MKNIFFVVIILFLSGNSCNTTNETGIMDDEVWKLAWRMMENSWDKNYTLAESQFDSLLSKKTYIEEKFIVEGIRIKSELSNDVDLQKILKTQSNKVLVMLCEKDFASNLKPCINEAGEKVQNEVLKRELIEMFVADQAIRGNVMRDIISEYQIDSSFIKFEYDRSNPDEIDVDEINRNRLKEIFRESGFPTRQKVGKLAMNGVFHIIQHSDGDRDWQKSQLINIENAALSGDLGKNSYAYLYDRIMVNSNQQQRYGTQFLKVDKRNGIVVLKDTEDLANLNKRRREMGMMPIEMYKKSVLEN